MEYVSQLDKRKKLEDEAGNKALEAEGHYRACVDESNSRHRNLLDVKSQVSYQGRREASDSNLSCLLFIRYCSRSGSS